jgi:hypothetical protein
LAKESSTRSCAFCRSNVLQSCEAAAGSGWQWEAENELAIVSSTCKCALSAYAIMTQPLRHHLAPLPLLQRPRSPSAPQAASHTLCTTSNMLHTSSLIHPTDSSVPSSYTAPAPQSSPPPLLQRPRSP